MRRFPWDLMLLLVAFTICSGLQAQPVTVGDEFQVNTYTTAWQQNPAVAVESSGDFVVVWQSYGSGGSDSSGISIQGQRYASDGSVVGGEFQVNTYTTSNQLFSAVAADSGGDFVVVWYSYGSGGSDSDSWSIQGQRYASDGSVVGDEFQVNTYTTAWQQNPAVAVESSGDFVVAWESYGSSGTDSDARSIQGQRYASDGSVLGDEFQVNTYTTSSQSKLEVAVEPDGDFVVVWQSYGSGGTDSWYWSIQGQRYTSGGSVVGDEFQVNTYTTAWQQKPAVAVESSGDFVVAWESYGSGGTDSSTDSIQGQRYASDGSGLGGEFQVNTYTTSDQRSPAVAVESGGDFVVVWYSEGSGGSDLDSYSIQGQRYEVPFFADGFESGDTSAW